MPIHAHPDHVQGAPALREHTGARVLIHAAGRATGAARIPADVTAIGFGHGAPLSGQDADGFRAFLAARH